MIIQIPIYANLQLVPDVQSKAGMPTHQADHQSRYSRAYFNIFVLAFLLISPNLLPIKRSSTRNNGTIPKTVEIPRVHHIRRVLKSKVSHHFVPDTYKKTGYTNSKVTKVRHNNTQPIVWFPEHNLVRNMSFAHSNM